MSNAGLDTVAVPKGLILPWYNTTNAPVPAGWALCDGTQGTPDLRGRFLRGAASASGVGGTGGRESHSHSISKGNYDGAGFQSEGDQCRIVVPSDENHVPPYTDVQFLMKI
jgi:hypothetical protein